MNTNTSSPSNTNYDVADIGGGPGGAALATFLARNGHRCVVFEQLCGVDEHAPAHAGYGMAGWSPARAAMR